ncbi:MAG: M36 family metallopeptidase [Thermoleophilia bacterium]
MAVTAVGSSGTRRRALALAGGVVAAAAWASGASAVGPDEVRAERAPYDAREGLAAPVDSPAVSGAAVSRLDASLGAQGVVQLDPLTGTPRVVARLDGFLTGPSDRPATEIALDYVRAHPDVFGLDADDIARLELVRDYVSIDGARHLVWAQTAGGVPAFDTELRANVTADGRLINVLGSPLPDLTLPSTTPGKSATQALAAARADVGDGEAPVQASVAPGPERETTFADGSEASLTAFNVGGHARLAWRVVVEKDSTHVYHMVVDAQTGKVLFRQSLVSYASGLAWDYFPGQDTIVGSYTPALASGGTQTSRNLDAWLAPGATTLTGPNVHVYADTLDDNTPDPGDEIPQSGGGNWNYPFTSFANFGCTATFVCSWDPFSFTPWQTNVGQNAVQVFYYVNRFHDYLEDDPNIGFTPAAGNFEGSDPVQAQVLDGAAIASGFPDNNHLNNANMATREDGQPPRMQMYLFFGSGFINANGGDDASIIYHEYIHGLSNRLVTDAAGFPALRSIQARSMGEAWSDWYAMNYLDLNDFDRDSAAPGDLIVGCYVDACSLKIRTQAIDCRPTDTAVGTCAAPCGSAAGNGGYTYADFGRILNGPEVHADGEIWAQTLWDIRQSTALGVGSDEQARVNLAECLVTRAMELSPPDPTFLDMRNAIIQAAVASCGASGAVDALWQIFAARGMGFFAGTLGGADAQPVASFDVPPAPGQVGTLAGTVTDVDTGAPVTGARVSLPGLASGFPSDLAATTPPGGQFSIANVPAGTYPYIHAVAPGYDAVLGSNVTSTVGGTTTVDVKLKRNFALASGGAAVVGFTGPDFTSSGCGPAGAIDGSYGTVWGSTSPNSAQGPGGTKSIVVRLATTAAVTGFGIDPGAGCGDDDNASLGQYAIEVSQDGASFTQVAAGTFTSADNHRLNAITPTSVVSPVAFVRLTMIAPQSTSGSGANFMDVSEFEVYGTPVQVVLPATLPPSPQPPPPGDTTAPGIAVQARVGGLTVAKALRSGVPVRIVCNEACTMSVKASITKKLARATGLAKKAVVVASAKGTLKAAGTLTIKVKFTRKAKAFLAGRRQLPLSFATVVTDTAGNRATRTSKATVRTRR